MADAQESPEVGVEAKNDTERLLSWLLGIGLLVAFAGLSVLLALGQQLELMHLPTQTGASPNGLTKGYLWTAVDVWRDFQRKVIRNVGTDVFVSPKTIVDRYLLIDSFIFVLGYLVTGLAFLLRGLKKSYTNGFLRDKVIPVAFGALLAAASFDLIENLLTYALVDRYWNDAPRARAMDWLLHLATIAKWVSAMVVVLALVPLTLNAISHRHSGSQSARTLLRPFFFVALVAFVLLNLPIQLTDLFLGLNGERAVKVASAALLLGMTLWASARMVIALHESRTPQDGAVTPKALFGLFILPALLLVWNLVAGGNPKVVAIPVGLIATLLLLGLILRDADIPHVDVLARRLPQSAITAPQIMASAMVAVVGVSALRALVLQWVQNGDTAVLWWLGTGLTLASILLAYAIFKVESWIVTLPTSEDYSVAGVRDLRANRIPNSVVRYRPVVYGGVVAFCAVLIASRAAALIGDPQNAPSVGAIAVVLTFLALLVLLTGAFALLAGWWTDRYGLPFVFRAFRLKTVPIFTLLLVWGVAAASIDDGSHWDVRVWPQAGETWTEGEPHKGMTLGDAFTAWKEQRVLLTEHKDRESVPLVILATSGGGIRSAYWTALSLDCLLLGKSAASVSPKQNVCNLQRGSSTADHTQSLFVASGVSGGSLGLVAWDANRKELWESSWVEDRLGGDFVAPSMAQGLFVELARSFLQFPSDGRAEALEDSWVRAWGEDDADNPMNQGFLASQKVSAEAGGPFLVLNGSSVFDGCALSVSFLDIGSTIDQSLIGAPLAFSGGDCTSVQRYTGPDFEESGRAPSPEDLAPGGDAAGALAATADLLDYLDCREATDVSRATAALLSARFPYVSSAGRLAACGGEDSAKFIVDGGYVDTSGAEAALAVWSAIDPLVQEFNAAHTDTCITPYFVQLDNGYLPTLSPRAKRKPPNQLLAPVQALKQATGLGSRGDRARASAAELFTRPYPDTGSDEGRDSTGRYVLIAPRAHPGVEAPLGWTLSEQSRRDLETQLYEGNKHEIAQVRQWLEEPEPC